MDAIKCIVKITIYEIIIINIHFFKTSFLVIEISYIYCVRLIVWFISVIVNEKRGRIGCGYQRL